MRAREGDLIETENKVIFDVKGLVHPQDKLIAFPRYIPSPKGARQGQQSLFSKIYSFGERFSFLEQKMADLIVHDPIFDETLCEVPTGRIRKHYQPIEKLRSLRNSTNLGDLERKALNLAKALKEKAGISWNTLGISGSVLAGLYTSKSDIDPVVYGVKNCFKAYAALEELLNEAGSQFKPYTREELRALFDFRSKDTIMDFEDFAGVESRKAFQGMYDGTDYFIRFVKDWRQVSEQYGDIFYKNSGYARITATIADDSEALFTPCSYKVKNVEVVEGPKPRSIKEIVSFRGRFCAQAKQGEDITAQGKIERVMDKKKENVYYRIILGNKPSDYMILTHLRAKLSKPVRSNVDNRSE
jgi:predicted nucleotidyltransferase